MMLNDRDNKYDGQEESEYHFSDEDVSYEVEPQPSQPKSGDSGAPKPGLGARLSSSKRMIISGVIFLVLVFVVYKMVTPTSSTQVTDIAAPSNQPTVAQQQSAPIQQNQATQAPVTPPPINAPATANPQEQMAGAQQSMPVQPTVSVTTTPVQTTEQPMQPPSMPNQSPAQAVMTTPYQVPGQLPQTVQTAPTMPAVIAVQSPLPYNVNPEPGTATSMGNLSADSQRLMNQFQSETAQRINDYAAQNKQLQEQIQALNSRVMNMEGQLNQLMQALTQNRTGATASGHTNAAPAQTHHSVEQPKMPYNVQAIIPGRAWLRSDNGETVTVAEGDVIRDLGRVTKIDPYDGVVEVNTGTKVVSLSYGNGG